MSQIHESRSSDHPYIDRVWRTQNLTDGTYLATPDGSWDLILGIDKQGQGSVWLTGQATRPAYIPYQAGTSSVVISFVAGAYLANSEATPLVNSVLALPSADKEHFKLAGHTFTFPDFEDAEELVGQMVTAGVLRLDDVVSKKRQAASERAIQRHFVRTTGLTPKKLKQVHRAQEAVRLLKQGVKPVDAAAEAGYADQPHLANSLKKIMHRKPSDVDDIHKL